jgi:hypothetical protein
MSQWKSWESRRDKETPWSGLTQMGFNLLMMERQDSCIAFEVRQLEATPVGVCLYVLINDGDERSNCDR